MIGKVPSRCPLVVRANVLGFCMGVRRAVDLACAEAQRSTGRVYTLGPLIHNPQALEDLNRRGVVALNESDLRDNLNGVSVIIRAHGVSPQTEADLHRRGAAVIDATCPKVKASQLKASALAEDDYKLFLAGEESHAEITGILRYAEAGALKGSDRRSASRKSKDAMFFCAVVGSAVEAEAAAAKLFNEDSGAKTALIAQTTISTHEYRAIGGAIARFFPDLEIAQTICAATTERQESLRELLDRVDGVIVAGGKESANTRRLLAIAEAAGKPCVLVQTPHDIPSVFFNLETVGLAAGASTPDTVIDAIEKALKKNQRKSTCGTTRM